MTPIKLPQFRKTAQVTLAIALLNAASVDAVWANLTTETIAFDITDQSVIKGIVKDQDGKPIDGGTIINETSKQSTRTEFNGKFNLKGQTGDQIRISSLGYKTVTITATDNLLEVVLEKDMFSAGFTVFPESQKEFGSGSNGKYEFWDGADGGISDGDMTWGPKLNSGIKVAQWNSPIRDKQTGEVIPWWGDVSGTKYNDKSRYERVPIDWVAHNNLEDFLGTGLITENNATLSYRSEKVSIFGTGKYAYQKGQVPNTKLSTAGLNLNTSYRFTPEVQLDLNLSYNKVKSPNYPRYGYGPKNHMYTILLWMGNDVNGQEAAFYF